MSERWMPVPGLEGAYEVSSLGRVRSVDREIRYSDGRVRQYRGQIVSSRRHPSGYMLVTLYRDARPVHRRVHQLVLEAFVGPRQPGEEALHWPDTDRSNNRLENLRWGTSGENKLDAVRGGSHHNAKKTHCKSGHEFTSENTYLRGGKRQCRACERARGRRRAR